MLLSPVGGNDAKNAGVCCCCAAASPMETVFSCFSCFRGGQRCDSPKGRFRPMLSKLPRAPFIHPRARRSSRSFSYTWYTLYQRTSAVPVAHCCRGRPGRATDGESLNRCFEVEFDSTFRRVQSATVRPARVSSLNTVFLTLWTDRYVRTHDA